jgi:hypothetical protein
MKSFIERYLLFTFLTLILSCSSSNPKIEKQKELLSSKKGKSWKLIEDLIGDSVAFHDKEIVMKFYSDGRLEYPDIPEADNHPKNLIFPTGDTIPYPDGDKFTILFSKWRIFSNGDSIKLSCEKNCMLTPTSFGITISDSILTLTQHLYESKYEVLMLTSIE